MVDQVPDRRGQDDVWLRKEFVKTQLGVGREFWVFFKQAHLDDVELAEEELTIPLGFGLRPPSSEPAIHDAESELTHSDLGGSIGRGEPSGITCRRICTFTAAAERCKDLLNFNTQQVR